MDMTQACLILLMDLPGTWVVNSSKVKITETTDTSCVLEILTGKPTKFTLKYISSDGSTVEQEIAVQSF